MRFCFEKPILSFFDVRAFENQTLYDRIYGEISAQRRQKVDSLRYQKDQWLSLAAGYLLEQGLKELGEGEYEIGYGPFGKPYLQNIPDLHFSLSHSGHYAVCVFDHRPVGVDIEQLRPVSGALLQKVCTERERRFLNAQSPEKVPEIFCRLWTAKESFMKLEGRGLQIIPKTIEVQLEPSMRLLCNQQPADVSLEEYTVEDHHITVATRT